MQQTEKYQLNLIETSDTFSPAPLNENAQKTEAAIAAETAARAAADTAETAARAAADAALDQRLQVFEAHHVVVGTYAPIRTGRIEVDLGFQPKAVVALNDYGFGGIILTTNGIGGLTSNGFYISAAIDNGVLNRSTLYNYIAFD